jgi:hypothetical protein
MRGGDRVHAPGIGWLILDAVEAVDFESLTHADALADGFASLNELRRAVRRIYPRQDDDGKTWFRVRFRLEAIEPMQRLAARVRLELDKAVQNNGS